MQLPAQSVPCCVMATCAGYMTQRLTCQETREVSSLSTSDSFQCLAFAEYFKYKTEMGVQKK